MALTDFAVELHANGTSHVRVAGVDLTGQVTDVGVEVHPGTVPKVHLVLVGDGVIEGLAEVVVHQPAVLDMDAVQQFLAALDPDQLEKDVTANLGWGEGNYTQALLTRLQEIAGGR